MGARELHRHVMPTKSYLSQSELPVTLGLGKVAAVDEIQIRWPSGRVQTLESIQYRTTQIIVEPQ
jgi:hypothetical protein